MISVIIPVRLINNQVANFTTDCIQSLKGYDELIVQFDMKGEGFAKTVNNGVARSKGDWIAIVNNDTRMLNGSIKDMCRYDCLVRPVLIEGAFAKFAFAVMPRKIWDVVGGLSEDYGIGFYEDNEFLKRAADAGFHIEDSPLSVWHFGGATIQHFNSPELMIKNREIYESKFGTNNE